MPGYRWPATCPECKADLTVMGAVGHDSSEWGSWTVRVTDTGDLEFGEFTTEDTQEVARKAYCEACGNDLEQTEEDVFDA